MDDDKHPKISSDLEKIYQLHRGRIAHEENLIHYRTLWMLGSQTILFVLFGNLYDRAENSPAHTPESYIFVLKCLEVLLFLCGAASAVGSGYWLYAAVQEIEYIKGLYDDIIKRFPLLRLPEEKIFQSVVGQPRRHWLGLIGAMFLPVFFVIVWIFIFIIFILKPWEWPTPYQGLGGSSPT